MSYIFVGGAQRSGTTLLQLILAQAPGVNPFVGEASYLRALVEVYANERHPHRLEGYFDSPDEFRAYHGAIVRGFLERTRQRFPGTTHLLLKEPTLARYFPELCDLVGDEARLVCTVRDPRDTVCSMLNVVAREEASGTGPTLDGDRVTGVCTYYRSFYAPLLTSGENVLKRVLFVRYEDLVQTPEGVIGSLERWLGLNLSNALHQERLDTGLVDFSSDSARRSPWHSDLWGKPITAARVGAYKAELTPEEIVLVERTLEDFFHLFKFETSGSRPESHPGDPSAQTAKSA